MNLFRRLARPRALTWFVLLLMLGALVAALVLHFRGPRPDPLSAAAHRESGLSAAAHRESGRQHLEAGRLTEALADLDAAVTSDPSDADALLLRGRARYLYGNELDRLEDFRAAVADADAALRLDPSRAAAYAVRARANAARDNFVAALSDAEEAVRRAPEDPDSLDARALVRLARGEVAEAVADTTEAIRRSPDRGLSFAKRGLARLERGEEKEALTDCDRAVQSAPNDSWSYVSRGHVHANAGRRAQALADLDRALALAPGNVPALATRAFVRLESHDTAGARADADAALALNPDSPNALAARAAAALTVGRRTHARYDVERAIRAAPEDPGVRLARALILSQIKEYGKAAQDCDWALAREGYRSAAASALRAVCRLALGDGPGAVSDCDVALGVRPNDVDVLVLRSLARARGGAAKEAEADFQAAARIDAHKAHAVRAEFLLALGDDARRALPDLDEAIRLDPEDGGAYLGRARANLDEHVNNVGDNTWADCDRAVQLRPKSPTALVVRAAFHGLKNDHRLALWDCKKAIELDREEVLAHVGLAEAQLRLSRPAEAVASATTAIELEPNEGYAYAIRGAAYADQKEHTKAAADLEKATSLDPRFKKLKEAHDEQVAAEKRQESPPFGPPPKFPDWKSSPFPETKPAGEGRWAWVLIAAAVVFVGAIIAGYARGRSRA
jgi:tetratricopeptide (TPR) repeat protein